MSKWILAARFVGIGWYTGIVIAGGIIGGVWLDNKLGTSLVCTVVGIFLGLGMAALGIYRMLSPLMREQQHEEDN